MTSLSHIKGAGRRSAQSVGFLAVLLVLGLVWLPGLPVAVSPGGTGGSHHAAGAPTQDVVNATVQGYVLGSRGPASPLVPIAGVNVTATASDFHTVVATTVSNATGAYSLSVAPGDYYIWSNSTANWGGGGSPDLETVPAGDTSLNLTAYPYIGYGNATFVLPGWNSLAPYMKAGNVMDSQQPMLSWTQDGAIYVNTTDELVFYSFANGTVTPIAPWTPLYENVMNYDGWENEEFLTPDGSWVYGLGCLASCASGSVPTLYAVNVSTGRTFEYNWSVKVSSLADNAQINLIGENGNLSTALLIDEAGETRFYGLWNGTVWDGPTLPFFEANNIYWIPQLDSYVDVEAHGSSSDEIVQWKLVGPGDGTGFDSVATYTYGSDFPTNAVNGPAFNVSSRELVFSCLSRGAWDTVEYSVSPAGILQNRTVLDVQVPGTSVYPDERLALTVNADEHRASLIENAPSFAVSFWPYFDNDSFVANPFAQEFIETNQSAGVLLNSTYAPDQSAGSSDSADGLYFNGSYMISPGSTDCDAGSCPINGAGGLPSGTIWWLWRVGEPEFPSPVTAPLAQTAPPGPISVTNSTTASSLALEWTAPTTGVSPLLNYSILWGYAPGNYTSAASVPASEQQFNVSGLPPDISVYFAVTAWNLHWHGPITSGVGKLLPGPPLAPTRLHATGRTARSLALAWRAPPESVSGYTLEWGKECSDLDDEVDVTSGPADDVVGLVPGTHYCFEVLALNAYGASVPSSSLTVSTLGKVGGRALAPTPDIPFVPVPPPPSPATCAGICFPSVPTIVEPQFWVGLAVGAIGAFLLTRGKRAGGGALLAVGIVLFFL